MSKIIFIVEYLAQQPLLLRTEGIYDISTRAVGGKEVPSIISRKMIRPLRDTLRDEIRKTEDEWIKKCKFPTEEMCGYCLDCLIFGGTRTTEPRIQIRSLVHPTDALAITGEEDSQIETETHVAVKEGRWADIGRALYSPFQVPQGTRFIGTLMVDFDKTKGKVDKEKLIKLLGTIFLRTRRYGGRTAQEGLVDPKVLAVIEVPYECVTSYELYEAIRRGKNIDGYIKKLQKDIPDVEKKEFQVIKDDESLKKTINSLAKSFRDGLREEGFSLVKKS